MTKRENFEAWAQSKLMDIERLPETGVYRNNKTRCAWQAVEAAQAQSAERVAKLERALRQIALGEESMGYGDCVRLAREALAKAALGDE